MQPVLGGAITIICYSVGIFDESACNGKKAECKQGVVPVPLSRALVNVVVSLCFVCKQYQNIWLAHEKWNSQYSGG